MSTLRCPRCRGGQILSQRKDIDLDGLIGGFLLGGLIGAGSGLRRHLAHTCAACAHSWTVEVTR